MEALRPFLHFSNEKIFFLVLVRGLLERKHFWEPFLSHDQKFIITQRNLLLIFVIDRNFPQFPRQEFVPTKRL